MAIYASIRDMTQNLRLEWLDADNKSVLVEDAKQQN